MVICRFTSTYTHAYTCRIIHNDTRIKNEWRTSLTKTCTSHFIVTFEKVNQSFMVRGSWRPNGTAIYWPQLIWPSALCLSHSPDAQLEARRLSFLLSAGFFYHILSPTGLQNYWGPRGPLRPGVAFPTTSYQQFLSTPTHQGLQGPHRPGVAFPTTSCL